ncbi:uncharacterized protein LOC111358984 [Spodoptera litura]|uniref:Uncharacterized protein LOC111358984 n=1 Tax=Spodoptera litura TaxID=69820 RepID=A0A9J7ELG7_SPOLT|nr:uncharacterized protein LOC111358984 [Spodoptera litura]
MFSTMLVRCVCLLTILALSTVKCNNIEKRIAGLKQRLRQEIEEDQRTTDSKEPGATTKPFKLHDYYDLVVPISDKSLIKPIMENYIKPNNHNIVKGNLSTIHDLELPKRQQNSPKKKKLERLPINQVHNKNRVTPANIFHRRFYLDEEERNKPQKWTHCLDLITPRLKGYKDDWAPKQVTHNDGDVRRLAHLLSLNTSEYTKEEIISTLYQISNIRLRIFQWDYTALTTILNIIIKSSVHDFRSLKSGLKELFKGWHLDTSMVATFLKQTRIFRPPCIEVSEYGGSTKTTGGVRISKPYKQQNNKDRDEDDCDEIN